MKVAIPIRNGRVSPVFDAASRVVVFDFEGGEPVGRTEFSIREDGPGAKAEILQDLGVTTLICGAISNHAARFVRRCGIELLPWIVGEVDDVIEAYCNDSLGTEGFTMPGCGRGRGAGRGRRRAGGGGGSRGGAGGGWKRTGERRRNRG